MKKTSENKRICSKPGIIKKAAESFKKHPVKGTLTALLSAALLSVLGIAFWIFVIIPDKGAPSGVPRKYYPVSHIGRGILYDTDVEGEFQDFIAYMYESNVSDDLFTRYYAYDSFMSPYTIPSVRKYGKYVTAVLSDVPDDEFPSYLILGIDPYKAFLQSCSNKDTFTQNLDFLCNLAGTHPASVFAVMLPADSATKWNSYDPETLKEARLSYIMLVRKFAECPNIHVYYHSLEEWVLYSNCLRESGSEDVLLDRTYNNLIATDISTYDLSHLLVQGSVNDLMDSVIDMSSKYDETLQTYADLSGTNVVFVGDSIFGNFRDETGVCSFFEEMTGATVYNLGEGGMSASDVTDPSNPLSHAFNYLIGKESVSEIDKYYTHFDSYNSFRLAGTKLPEGKGENTVFIVEYGLNDYFGGVTAEDYYSSMTEIIKGLKDAYPNARILILSAGYISMYNNGGMAIEPDSAPLQTYRDIAAQVSEEYGCEFLSLTDDFGFTQEQTLLFLNADLVHYNERGRYQLAQVLARYFK